MTTTPARPSLARRIKGLLNRMGRGEPAGLDNASRLPAPLQDVYRPRDATGPQNVLDFWDRHVSRATESPELSRRYASWAWRLLLGGAVAFALLVLGMALAVHFVGLTAWTATVGAMGATVAIRRAVVSFHRGQEP